MTQSLFDPDQFLQSLAQDMELAKELLNAFMEDSTERVRSLDTALSDGDLATAARLAHSLKGMSGVTRSKPLVHSAFMMEAIAKEGDLVKMREHFIHFSLMLEEAQKSMEAFLNE